MKRLRFWPFSVGSSTNFGRERVLDESTLGVLAARRPQPFYWDSWILVNLPSGFIPDLDFARSSRGVSSQLVTRWTRQDLDKSGRPKAPHKK